jgi:hypothetical protein
MNHFTYNSLVENRKKKNMYKTTDTNRKQKNMCKTTDKEQPLYKQKDITLIIDKISKNKYVIENVYQQKYNNNIYASGLGDFIRGCYFLMQFCQERNIPYNINILSHPISKFLDIYKNKKRNNNIEGITKFKSLNFKPLILDNGIITNISNNKINDEFICYLGEQTPVNNVLYTYITPYPTKQIEQRHKELMKIIFKPTDTLLLLVDKKMSNLNLTKYNYSIIHIRFGDDHLVHSKNIISNEKYKQIFFELKKINPFENYLLISDNKMLKKYIIHHFPFIKTHLCNITHTGGDIDINIDNLENTMIDFCLMSFSSKILSFSVYPHGSGFSQWCSVTYDIPYICKLIK